jgi:gluconate 5-dehydrogenase
LEEKTVHIPSLFDLGGKTALITGSSRGLGRVIARGLADAGASVVLNGRHEEPLRKTTDEFRSAGLDAHFQSFDVTDEGAVVQGVRAVESGVGPIDVLVNNAGVNLRSPCLDIESKMWREVLSVNLEGPMRLAREVARGMRGREEGKIINICSLLSERPRPECAPYAASKAGLKMLTKSLAVELGPHNIQVNGIGPGYFVTRMTRPLREDPEFDRWVREKTPAGRWGDPEELVGAAVFLAGSASSFVNGQIVYVDGGWLAQL